MSKKYQIMLTPKQIDTIMQALDLSLADVQNKKSIRDICSARDAILYQDYKWPEFKP